MRRIALYDEVINCIYVTANCVISKNFQAFPEMTKYDFPVYFDQIFLFDDLV